MTDPVVIIGSGIAGLVTALALAPRPVLLLTRAGLGQESATARAQGGIAAALGPDDDTGLHLADTLAAGAGLCDAGMAERILESAPDVIAMLARHGLRFDVDETGAPSFGLEAAHSRKRILHTRGDGTGAAITDALSGAVRNCAAITVLEHAEALRLLTAGNRVGGVVIRRQGRIQHLAASSVVLATGGIGGLYDASTNPTGNCGAGIAMAACAGAELADMEFVQFHPTALATARRPLSLISEAVRGEGALLLNDLGQRFMLDVPGAELAPRDLVARAIHAQIAEGRRVFLDARAALGDRFAARFPGIFRLCAADGIDPSRDLIPVRPAVHYHMGGIATDARGRSSLAGLWAVGECASTGLHGANRLASNSLLEAAAMGLEAARDIADQAAPPLRMALPDADTMDVPPGRSEADAEVIRAITSQHLGVLRDAAGLDAAIAQLLPLAQSDDRLADPALVALAIAVFARLRDESRGAHARTDFPEAWPQATRRHMTLPQILVAARDSAVTQPIARSA
ncbi:L-aspartate oxidase [Paracoccus xiamenensis]|uniref:L-aspartate oxidase n=1 Tax=Paracoccus xiamenensis TaxID=2714901 RepID=UPI00140B92EC|nr:L-aspartate oxidase [Paracoccus xiamenensis]NHF73483.1 L-aspartate oxidase [Paracoccus xiamenensis]